ncbi:hypothetical protein Droror1_Dr00006442 [Drosera rotundifolia]
MNPMCLVYALTFTAFLVFHSPTADGRSVPVLKGEHFFKQPKGTIKTIVGDDGEVVDCVDIHKQPAFDHLLLKNHKIQMEPSTYPKGIQPSDSLVPLFLESWRKNGKCPDDAIPIRRRVETGIPITKRMLNVSLATSKSGPTHQYAVMQYYAPTAGTIKGGHGIFDVWNPSLNTSSDFSLTQIWVVSGSGSNVNTMEAGWQKYPARTGDNQTHFFIYWTRDSYNQTGCYDLYCAGFVQSNKQMTIGAPLNVSTYNGKQVEVEILIDKDNSSGNWWLYVNNQTVGYWPPSIFTALANGADNVQWGGEIYENSGSGGQHTNTQMGSGHFPSEGYRNASYVRGFRYKNATGYQVAQPSPVYQLTTVNSCWTMQVSANATDYMMFYGGPGCS